jgi:hypothetical protein
VAGVGGVTSGVAAAGGTITGGALGDDEVVDEVVEGLTVALAVPAEDSALAARACLGVAAAVLSRVGAEAARW